VRFDSPASARAPLAARGGVAAGAAPENVRLASRIFLATALVTAVLVAVAVWSLVAMDELVTANRQIVTRTVPAIRLETALHESMTALVRLETRYAVLRDAAYQALWSARIERSARDLEALGPLLVTRVEMKRHLKAKAAFARYRRVVEAQHARLGEVHEPIRLVASEVRRAAERARRSLQHLQAATFVALGRAERQAARLEQRTRSAVASALPATVIVALFAAAWLARRLTRSLADVSAATREVAEGSFAHPVVVRGRDEIATLAESFNRMAERLREVDRLKEEFFSHISHELRTPLTAVREAVHLLQDGVPGPLAPRQARLVDITGDNTERVLRLVNQILDLSRLQAGLLGLDRRPVDLPRVVQRAVEQVRPHADARGLVLESNGTGVGGAVIGDEERLLQVVLNLVGNAIRFTPAGGAVRLHVSEESDDVELSVEDTGPGIPPDALPRIFDRYWQARGTRGGSGLGLAIVKSIVELHGGRVRAESVDGQGSRFVVRLPRLGRAA
jgi:signal transduction histidine kinase